MKIATDIHGNKWLVSPGEDGEPKYFRRLDTLTGFAPSVLNDHYTCCQFADLRGEIEIEGSCEELEAMLGMSYDD